VRRYKWWMT